MLAAIAGLLSGCHANEAMIAQIEASDQWAFYQAKGIKAAILDAKQTLRGQPNDVDRAKSAQYAQEQSKIEKEARDKQAEVRSNFHKHEIFAHGVTMFQIVIAVAAIS